MTEYEVITVSFHTNREEHELKEWLNDNMKTGTAYHLRFLANIKEETYDYYFQFYNGCVVIISKSSNIQKLMLFKLIFAG